MRRNISGPGISPAVFGLVLAVSAGLILSAHSNARAENYPDPETYPVAETAGIIPAYPAAPTRAIQSGIVRGRVLEKGTRKPIEGASVFLLPTSEYTLTDKKGVFSLTVPAGEYQLSAVMVDFKKPEPETVAINPGEEMTLTVYLEKSFYSLMEVVVESRRERQVSEQVIQKVEAEKVAGTSGDIIRSVQTLPGVTSGGVDLSGALFVRGGGPDENFFVMDLAPVANLFHFGGWYSTINPDMIEDIRFFAGGFGPDYGFIGGGVLDITTREGRRDRIGGKADVNFFLASGQVEGPLTQKGSFFLSGRRSYLDIFPLSSSDDLSIYPRFWDYQAKLAWDVNERNKLSLFTYGSADTLIAHTGLENRGDPVLSGSMNTELDFHAQVINWRSLLTPRLSLRLAAFNSIDHALVDLNRDLYIDSRFQTPGMRGYLEWDLPARNRFRLGADVIYIHYWVKGQLMDVPTEEDAVPPIVTFAERLPANYDDSTAAGGAWIEDEINLWKFKLIPGVRLDYVQILKEVDLSPRFRFHYQIIPGLKLKGAFGFYYQTPNPAQFFEPFGNPGIDSTRVVHYVLGAEKEFGKSLSLDLQGYYKDYQNMVAEDPVLKFNNRGKGYATGVEVFLRHRLSQRFFGWLTYSYTQSRRWWPGQRKWSPSAWEQPHSIALVLNYQFSTKWNAGAQWRYQSGMHYTKLKPGFYDADWDLWYPMPDGELNAAKLSDYQRLDVRIERLWLYKTWKLSGYLEIQNVYMHKNVIGIIYADDWTDPRQVYWIPILPFMGMKAEF
ncbi:MAG: TonB-dependent receptor [bacterium]|nr:TonB-dependent receptor [bacterium]